MTRCPASVNPRLRLFFKRRTGRQCQIAGGRVSVKLVDAAAFRESRRRLTHKVDHFVSHFLIFFSVLFVPLWFNGGFKDQIRTGTARALDFARTEWRKLSRPTSLPKSRLLVAVAVG